MNPFFSRLFDIQKKKKTCLCVGLDPDPARMPAEFGESDGGLFEFCREIAGATAEFACAFKPNAAFFEAAGSSGVGQLERLVDYIHETTENPVILDAKRGDIGNTARMYARAAFENMGADAITVNPYLGTDTLSPFLEYTEKGIFVLCLTSNPGYSDFEDIRSDGIPLYETVARRLSGMEESGSIGLVVGATHPEEARRVRNSAPELPFLMPGIGAQGGDPAVVIDAGTARSGMPPVVNSSRGIIYAGGGADFAEAAHNAARQTRDKLNQFIDWS